MELTEKTPKEFVDELFESDKVKALMLYVICMWGMDPMQSGVGYLIPLYVNRASNYRLAVHGSHSLAQALIKDYMTHGGKIFSPYGLKSRVRPDSGTTYMLSTCPWWTMPLLTRTWSLTTMVLSTSTLKCSLP